MKTTTKNNQLIKTLWIAIYSLLITIDIPLSGQKNDYPLIISDIAEELIYDNQNLENGSEVLDMLHELYDNPVKINSNQTEEISRLFFLNEFQIRALIDHIHSTGEIVSIYEIADIPGFDRTLVETMTPFIALTGKPTESDFHRRLRQNLISNISLKPCEKDTSALGSGIRHLTKYKLTAGHFQAGFTIEKDMGETFFAQGTRIPDFLSAHLSWAGTGIVRKIIIGDFSAKFGQGTNINTRFGTSLSLTGNNFISGRNGISPYTSTDENRFFRGIGTQLAVKKLNINILLSHKKNDATLRTLPDSTRYVSNLYTSGLHNTASSLLKKDALTISTAAFLLSYNFKKITLGSACSTDFFSLPFLTDRSTPEKAVDFTGKRNSTLSLYYSASFNRIMLFGEASFNNLTNKAIVQGINIRPTDRMTVNMIYRNYSKGFTTFNGRGPGFSSSTSNEEGFFGNITFEAARKLFIIAGADISNSAWIKYRSDFPTRKQRQEIRIKFTPSEKTALELSYFTRFSMSNKKTDTGVAPVNELNTNAIRLTAKFVPTDNLILTTKEEYKIVSPSDRRGAMIVQNIYYSFRNVPLTLWTGFSIFNTDDWDSRIYTYENDLLYSFSIPAMYGNGSRAYLMLRWKIAAWGDIRLKYGITSKTDRNKKASGSDELKLQIRINL